MAPVLVHYDPVSQFFWLVTPPITELEPYCPMFYPMGLNTLMPLRHIPCSPMSETMHSL